MSPSKFFLVPREAMARRPIRRKHRVPLAWERLEPRQLLSAGAIEPSTASTLVQPFVQVSPMAGPGSTAYSPQQIAAAYGINDISFSGVTGDGSGQTIAIVDAYSEPNIQADLDAF